MSTGHSAADGALPLLMVMTSSECKVNDGIWEPSSSGMYGYPVPSKYNSNEKNESNSSLMWEISMKATNAKPNWL